MKLAIAAVVGLALLHPAPEPRAVLPGETLHWLSPDGAEVVTTDSLPIRSIRARDTRTGNVTKDYHLPRLADRIFDVSADGSLVLTEHHEEVNGHLWREGRRWTVAVPHAKIRARAHLTPPIVTVWGHDGPGSVNNQFLIVAGHTGEVIGQAAKPYLFCSATSDESALMLEEWNGIGKRVDFWHAATRQFGRTFEAPASPIVAPEAGVLIVRGAEKDRKSPVEIWDWPPGPEPRHVLEPLSFLGSTIVGKTMLATFASWTDIDFWDLQTGKKVATVSPPPDHGPWYAQFSPDGRRFALLSADLVRNFTFTMHAVPSGDVLWSRPVKDIAFDDESPFSPDGRVVRVLLHAERPAFEFIDVESGKTLRAIPPLRLNEEAGQHERRQTPDGRFYLHCVQHLGPIEPLVIEETWWERLGNWWLDATSPPAGWCTLTVIDMRDASVALRVTRPSAGTRHAPAFLSHDGSTLVLPEPGGLSVWDVPAKSAPGVALAVAAGVWLALTMVGLAFRMWTRSTEPRSQPPAAGV